MWKERLLALAEGLKHPAWGIAHSRRVHELAMQLACERNEEIDEDALFAAAYLHDIGAFEPYKRAGTDHAERSAQVVRELLESFGFPEESIPLVQGIIRRHMFYENPTAPIEAILFHDADTLAFMGAIGVTRLLSIVGLDDWAPDLPTAVRLIESFSQGLPERLHTPEAQRVGEVRKAEMIAYLSSLSGQTHGLKTL